jgi:hypothetical protein
MAIKYGAISSIFVTYTTIANLLLFSVVLNPPSVIPLILIVPKADQWA